MNRKLWWCSLSKTVANCGLKSAIHLWPTYILRYICKWQEGITQAHQLCTNNFGRKVPKWTTLLETKSHWLAMHYRFFILGISCMAIYCTAQFKLYTSVQVHVCACMFNACKTLKPVMCTHCCTWFWRAHVG